MLLQGSDGTYVSDSFDALNCFCLLDDPSGSFGATLPVLAQYSCIQLRLVAPRTCPRVLLVETTSPGILRRQEPAMAGGIGFSFDFLCSYLRTLFQQIWYLGPK